MEKASSSTGSAYQREPRNFKGVRLRKWGKWIAEISVPNSRKKIWLGSYSNAEQAARAFDAALYCLRGPQSDFNFPDSPPNLTCVSDTPDIILAISRTYAMQFPKECDKTSSVSHGNQSTSTPVDELCLSNCGSGIAMSNNQIFCGAAEMNYFPYDCVPIITEHYQVGLEELYELDSFQNIWGFA